MFRATVCPSSGELPLSIRHCYFSLWNNWTVLKIKRSYVLCGPVSSVGIVTDFGLDGPGSNTGGDEIFRPSRPALWPTQPPVKWLPGLSPGGKVRPSHAADHSPPSSAAFMEE